MTDKLRAAMQQALEFLESGNFVYPSKLASALREALAEQAAQETMIYISSFELDDKPFRGVGSISPKTKLNFDMYLTEDNQNPMDNCFASTEELMLALGRSSEEAKRIHTNLENLTSTEQVEQEPFVEHAQYDQHGICRMQKFSNGVTEFYGQDGSVIMRLDSSSQVVMDYAAPVRTKDLTDEDFVQSEVKSLRQQVAALKAVLDAWNNVEQEPVAWVDLEQWQSGEYDCFTSEKVADYMTPLYATPVRKKDLTDDEIDAIEIITDRQFARAVIAAYKEKNK